MKLFFKIFLLALGVLFAISIGFTCYYLIATYNVKLDENKLVSPKNAISFYDKNNQVVFNEDKNLITTSIDEIPIDLINAFISIEDKRFYKHDGVDFKAIIRASVKNILNLSFKEGGSTISQQLIKNTHFTSDKTIKRKLSEIKLAKQLEKRYTKNEILEKYLNTIYFGNNAFGITKATKIYFNKDVKNLTLSECAMLAGIVKSPANFSPLKNFENCKTRRNLVLEQMYKQGYISKEKKDLAKKESINLAMDTEREKNSYFEQVKLELDYILDNKILNSDGINVYTNFDCNLQKILDENTCKNNNLDYCAVLTDKQSNVMAINSNVGILKRQLGSTIKPLLVYAPAIELNEIDECSFILDEKVDFGGYLPSNYNDVYYGEITAKFALSKSLNIPTLKILNSIGIDKAKNFINKTNLILSNEDLNLNVGLGITKNGYKLTDLTAVYASFINKGVYNPPTFIRKITDKNGKILYQNNYKNVKLFGEDTAFIINDMLSETAQNGTAKKLSALNYKVCSKTGTVGNEKGNTDVYNITYNGDYCLGVWYGKDDSSYFSNNITGGNLPTNTAYNVFNKLLSTNKPTPLFTTDKVIKVDLDKISFEKNIIETAEKIAPKRYVISSYFKTNRVPNQVSDRFTFPKIENYNLSVNQKGILISLCHAEYVDCLIYRINNGKKELVFDTKKSNDKKNIYDTNIEQNTLYAYTVLPYFDFENERYFGHEINLGQIKSPTKNVGDNNWWNDYF